VVAALVSGGASISSAFAGTGPAPPDPGDSLEPTEPMQPPNGPPVENTVPRQAPHGPAAPSPLATKATEMAPSAMVGQTGMRALQGTITSASGDKVSVHAQGGAQDSFYVDTQSAILRDGDSVKASQLQPGDTVRVNYNVRSGLMYATTITATSVHASKTPLPTSPP